MNIQLNAEVPQDEVWYRYEGQATLGDTETGLFTSGDIATVFPLTYRVVRHTPRGVWLDNGRFVLNDSRKRFAYPTKIEALQSLIKRKRRQLIILSLQQRRAAAIKNAAERERLTMEQCRGDA